MSQYVVKLQNLTGRISVPPFQKQLFKVDVLKSFALFTGKQKCFSLNIVQFL